jgi:hypothetical protein
MEPDDYQDGPLYEVDNSDIPQQLLWSDLLPFM